MVLKISNLNKIYSNGFKALSDLNISISNGERVALLGLNGAGKSTMVGILSGTIIKTSGSVVINNFDIDKDRIPATKSIGVVHQELIYDTFFTVEESIKIHAGYYGFDKHKNEIHDLMKSLDLYDKKDTNTRYLSGGMKRRLMIAKALITKPRLAILDEPTVGIDVTQRDKMYDYIEKLNQDEGITILLTTHYMEEAERLCDRIIVIDKGKVVADGSKNEIIEKFKTKEVIFNIHYLFDEIKSKNEIENNFFKNGIKEYKFYQDKLSVFYHDSKIEFDDLYQIIKSSGVKITNVKSSEGNLELAFKKIIEC